MSMSEVCIYLPKREVLLATFDKFHKCFSFQNDLFLGHACLSLTVVFESKSSKRKKAKIHIKCLKHRSNKSQKLFQFCVSKSFLA